MGKKQTRTSDSQSPSEALGRMHQEVLKLREEVEAEQARADRSKLRGAVTWHMSIRRARSNSKT